MNPELQRAAELAAEYIESFDTQRVSKEPDSEVIMMARDIMARVTRKTNTILDW